MPGESHKCVIWPEFPADKLSLSPDRIVAVTSERAGGNYAVDINARIEIEDLDDRVKARLTTWLVDQRLNGEDWPLVTGKVISDAQAQQPLTIEERAVRLLRYLVEQPHSLGEHLAVSRIALLAWTESTEIKQVVELEAFLDNRDWITGFTMSGPEILSAKVTVEGHSYIDDVKTVAIASSQAFVAMWFDESMKAAYEEGMEPAIREAGYRPFRVDREEAVDKIDDAIIAGIRLSRFLIADFTQEGDKTRGSVYYEAGFAHGFGLDVIFTCHENSIKKVHFDTRQYKHIVWATPEELRQQLRNRILAKFGEGPELDKSD